MLVRLQKLIADAGVASRRAGEGLIVAGRVAVNGQVVRQLGTKVDPAADEVRVDGEPLRLARKFYVALNKPPGYLCTRSDPEHRPVVADLLPREWRAVYPVGRLDRESEGLLFLTNDGALCLRLTHPRYGLRKKYRATIEGRVEPAVLARLTAGVVHEGQRLCATRAALVSAHGTRSVVELELAEGKNHEVRRLFAAQGLVVERLQRVQIGPIKLGELPLGKWRVLTPPEVRSLQGEPPPRTGRVRPRPGADRGSIDTN